MKKQLRHRVFWPPFIFILASAIYSLLDVDAFLVNATSANDWVLDTFSWAFSWCGFAFLLIVVITYFSKFGNVKIGGADAKPKLSKWRWFSITLCTTIATGILFWGTAEPLYHMHLPPQDLNIIPASPEAARFAMSTMMMHWSFTPYGIYTLAALLFAIVYYNMNQPFSLSSMLYPIMGDKVHGVWGDIVNIICLYSLVAGMAASLGVGILNISGGISSFFEIGSTSLLTILIAFAIVITFILSAASGLMRGIRLLSGWNIWVFVFIAVFMFVFGPTKEIIISGWQGISGYFQTFLFRSLDTGIGEPDRWTKSWTIFYWANWLAWTPISALFLGRLGLGYDVRTFIRFNLLYPSLFSMVWMSIFSGTSLYVDNLNGEQGLYTLLQDVGPEMVVFNMLEYIPFTDLLTIVFIVAAFISYVTAADSNTSAMSGISAVGITPDNPEAPIMIKVAWGSLIGIISWVLITYAGIDGIRMASNLGGLPALVIVILIGAGLVKILVKGDNLD
ncbi:MAG: BCCT family transporter [Bacteroidia bacterium]|nr:BCCT family transporter [Bacteroidia bacterium]